MIPVLRLAWPLLMTSSSVSCAGGVTLGPRVETHFVIVRAQHPLQILQNRGPAMCRRLDDDTAAITAVNIEGMYAMPPEHWEALMRRLGDLEAALPPGHPLKPKAETTGARSP